MVTDAGMPGISDPGERLVRAAVSAGHRVSVIAGPSAAIAALVVSGLPTGRFVFEGFLPRKGSGRTARLAALADRAADDRAVRGAASVAATIADLASAIGDQRRVVIVRELTKLHEEVWRGSLGDATCARRRGRAPRRVRPRRRGCARVRSPRRQTTSRPRCAPTSRLGSDRKTAVADVARELGVAKRVVYDASLRLTATAPGF